MALVVFMFVCLFVCLLALVVPLTMRVGSSTYSTHGSTTQFVCSEISACDQSVSCLLVQGTTNFRILRAYAYRIHSSKLNGQNKYGTDTPGPSHGGHCGSTTIDSTTATIAERHNNELSR